MTSAELCAALAVSRSKLRKWLRRGLPHTANARGHHDFDDAAVAAWLLANGIAEDPNVARAESSAAIIARESDLVKTYGQAAAALGVAWRSIAAWKAEGCPALQNGPPFSIAAIGAWRAGKDARFTAGGDSERAELQKERLRMQLERERLEFGKEYGRVLDRGEALRVILQFNTECHNVLEELREILPADMPEEVTPKARANMHAHVTERLDMVFALLADLAERLGEELGGADGNRQPDAGSVS